ncbi:MAG: hypothetical protein SO360_01895 [Bifidobacterium tsurumiense]|uniref:hypothetical protein n=1 Tax=Bifidobacterium tsurumiense TaxID=356829 RepID=UPI002A7EE218|nr:hypothetical protein [Bifidobacterium tsurumiense]MDY4677605.1 hypothetical protein [Bifidobacterium tsurumiense]
MTSQMPSPSQNEPIVQLWPEIRSHIEATISSNPRGKQVEIGPSELGTDCLHCLAAKLGGWPQSKAPAWLPFIGTSVHAQFEQAFRQIGTEETDDGWPRFETEKRVEISQINGIFGSLPVHGSIDLYDRKTGSTVDWKIVGNTTLKTVKAAGPSQQYRVQASLYGLGVENAGLPMERCCIYFLPRTSVSLDDAFTWESEWDPQIGKWALARAQLLVSFMDTIELTDGLEVRDQWISSLPKTQTHCFNCGTWPDDNLGEFSILNKPKHDIVPDKWKQLTQLLEPTYKPTENQQ